MIDRLYGLIVSLGLLFTAANGVCATEPDAIPEPTSLLLDQTNVLSDAERDALRRSRFLFLFFGRSGDDPEMRLAQGAAGGGSIAGILWAAARYGLYVAVKIGLGGRFGGGGAGRGDQDPGTHHGVLGTLPGRCTPSNCRK